MGKRDGLIFANARAKSKENGLLSEERLHRIMESKTVEDGMRVLAEIGYGGGMTTAGDDFYSLLKEEQRLATAFACEAAPKEIGFDCFFMKNDYHNMKVLLKEKYGKIGDVSEMIMPDGNISFAELKQRFEDGKTDFDPFMHEGIAVVDKAFEQGTGSPRLIDVEMDKAMFRRITSRLPSCDKCIRDYFTALIDLTNIESFVRTKKIKAGFSFFSSGFAVGGKIGLKDFEECGTDDGKFRKLIENSEYKAFWEKIESELCLYETATDDFLLKKIAANKADMFSVAPVLGYYLAKLNEVKILRVVFVCIKNMVSYEEMKKRVRALYA